MYTDSSGLSPTVLVHIAPLSTPHTCAFPWHLVLVCMRPRLASASDTGHAIPPTLAASTSDGGRSSLEASMSTTSVVSFNKHEVACVHGLFVASRSPLSGGSTSISLVEPLSEQEITQLRRVLSVYPVSPLTGFVGSTTNSFGIVRPPSTQVGTSSLILSTEASFYMTHDSSTLSSIWPLDSHFMFLL